jgi:hypothetical protein
LGVYKNPQAWIKIEEVDLKLFFAEFGNMNEI